MLKRLKRLSEVLCSKNVKLYCTTPRCTDPVRLDSDVEYQRLFANRDRTAVGSVLPMLGLCSPSTSAVPMAKENGIAKEDGLQKERMQDIGDVLYIGSCKRKSPITLRVTEVPPASSIAQGLTFRHLSTTTSAAYHPFVNKRTSHNPSVKQPEMDDCGACLWEEDNASDTGDVQWVSCDGCERRFHQSCAGYAAEGGFSAFCATNKRNC